MSNRLAAGRRPPRRRGDREPVDPPRSAIGRAGRNPGRRWAERGSGGRQDPRSVRVEGGSVPCSEIQIASVAGTTISIAASRCRCRSVAFAVRPRAQRLGRRVSRYARRSAAPHSDRRKQLIRRQAEPLLLIAEAVAQRAPAARTPTRTWIRTGAGGEAACRTGTGRTRPTSPGLLTHAEMGSYGPGLGLCDSLREAVA